MSNQLPRYNVFQNLPDTLGFFDYSVPYTNQSVKPVNDSVGQFFDFGIYDYISPPKTPKMPEPVQSLFTGHQLNSSDNGIRKIETYPTDWVTVVLLVCLLVVAWIQTNYSKRLNQIIKSMILPYYVNQLEREGNLYNERISLGLGFIFINAFSLLIYHFFYLYGAIPDSWMGFPGYLLIIAATFGFILSKEFLIRVTGIIFKTTPYAHSYRLNALIFNYSIGIILVPFLFLIYFWKPQPMLWIAAGIFIILLAYRFIRSVLIGISNSSFSTFYLILYLCTLEILPVVILVKLLRLF